MAVKLKRQKWALSASQRDIHTTFFMTRRGIKQSLWPKSIKSALKIGA